MIYAIRAGAAGPIKFGVAKNPRKRLAQLQTGSHEPLTLLVAVEMRDDCERQIHRWLRASHIRGEWFAFDEKAQSLLGDLEIRAALGPGDQTEPDPVAYEAEFRRRFPDEYAALTGSA